MSEFDFIKSTPSLGQMAMAKRMVDAVACGELSEWRFGCFQQELAKALHPEARSLGEAIAKTMDSEIGRIVWGPRRAVTTERNRVLMKRESGERDKKPHVHYAPAEPEDVDDDPDAQRRDHPELKLSRQQAITHVIEHTDEGRAAFERSKMRSVAKNAG